MRSRGILLHRSVAAAIAVGSLLLSATRRRAPTVSTARSRRSTRSPISSTTSRTASANSTRTTAPPRTRRLRSIKTSPTPRRGSPSKQARLGELAGQLGDIAVDKYVTGSALELSPLFSNAAAYTEAEQKDSLSRLALDSGSGSTDEMLALVRRSRQGAGTLDRKQATGRRSRRHARLQARRSPDSCRPSTSRSCPRRRPTSASRSSRNASAVPRRRGCRDRQAAAGSRRCRHQLPRPTRRRAPSPAAPRGGGTSGGGSNGGAAPAAPAGGDEAVAGLTAAATRGSGSRQRQRRPFRRWRHRGQCRDGSARRALQVRRRVTWRGIRLLGSHQVCMGTGRGVPAAPVRRPIRVDTARHASRDSTGRPRLLQVADRPCRASTSAVVR